jgi:hypothetical protein
VDGRANRWVDSTEKGDPVNICQHGSQALRPRWSIPDFSSRLLKKCLQCLDAPVNVEGRSDLMLEEGSVLSFELSLRRWWFFPF